MSMNMAHMPGPDSARNFFDSQLAHNKKQQTHNTHVEWMMLAGLLQQERMIQAQNQQMEQLNAINQQNERNRRLDIYSAELMHRGFSPLEANLQAQKELEYIELFEYVTNSAIECENKIENAEEIVAQEVTLKMGLIPTKKHKNQGAIEFAAEQLEESLRNEMANILQNAANKLNNMPFSLLFDDSSFRLKVQETSGIIVKLPTTNQIEKNEDDVVFSDENVSELFESFKAYKKRWAEMNNSPAWLEAINFLPEKFVKNSNELTKILDEVEVDFMNIKVISSDGGYSAEDAAKYLERIVSALNGWQESSTNYVSGLEVYVKSLGDSPVGKKLQTLLFR